MPALLALVDAIGRCEPVTEVSAVGFSNGGLMANALACRAARRIRAIVLVAAGYEGLGRCAPAGPVSVLSIHGSSDQVVAYRGLRAFVDTWARRDRCAPRPSARREVEGITHLRWHGCAAGTRVEHLRVAGDTHGWPSITDANQRMVRFHAPRVEARRSALVHPAGRGSGQMMGPRRLNRTSGGPTKGA